MSAHLQQLLKLETAPVAVTFYEVPPDGVPRTENVEPSGCTYWRRAAEGKTFYTNAADHYNCPIGCYTHNVELPAAHTKALEDTLGLMFELDYMDMAEVPAIPQRETPFKSAVYAPLSDTPDTPDVVIVTGTPKQLMLLSEAATAAGIGTQNRLMGRPTCAVIPTVIQTDQATSSLGCIGNRVYTALATDELYFVFPGEHIDTLVEKLQTIVKANEALEQYHQQRQREL